MACALVLPIAQEKRACRVDPMVVEEVVEPAQKTPNGVVLKITSVSVPPNARIKCAETISAESNAGLRFPYPRPCRSSVQD